jgi:hypothetical protein
MSGTGALLLLLVAGCSDGVTTPADYSLIFLEGDTYFVRQPVNPGAVMEALFQGKVIKDEGGCLRLQAPDDATVVWPYRSALDVRGDGQWIVGADGRDLGKIGGDFRFGGGEVPYLHEGLGFHEPSITEIMDRCPGRFWIVGEVLTP